MSSSEPSRLLENASRPPSGDQRGLVASVEGLVYRNAGADPSAGAIQISEATSPRWSPDGGLLAFSSKREGSDDDIWFLRTAAPGGEAFQIKGVHATPVFSANGQWLAY